MRHFLSLADLSAEEAREILQLAIDGKRQYQQGEQSRPMVGRTLALLFQKPSLRTRVSFEAGVNQLGGNTVFLSDDVGWGKRESMKDFSAVLSAYVDIIACRARAHQDVIALAEHAPCPVDRKSVVSGTSVDLGGRRTIKKKKNIPRLCVS